MVNYLCRASRGGARQTKDTDGAPKGDGVQQTLSGKQHLCCALHCGMHGKQKKEKNTTIHRTTG
jgi:hypothetical protein